MFSICLCDTCDCFYRGWHWVNITTWQLPMCPLRQIHCPWVRGLTRKEGSPSNWKWADAGLKLTALQYANFLCLFICFLMTPRSSQEGFFFSRLWKKKPTLSFFLLIICHWHIKVMDWSNFEWKVFSTLEMDAFESLPFNTNKCLCHSCPLRHTWTHILPLPTVHTFFPSSLSTQLSLPPCFNQSNANPSQHYMG